MLSARKKAWTASAGKGTLISVGPFEPVKGLPVARTHYPPARSVVERTKYCTPDSAVMRMLIVPSARFTGSAPVKASGAAGKTGTLRTRRARRKQERDGLDELGRPLVIIHLLEPRNGQRVARAASSEGQWLDPKIKNPPHGKP